MGESPFYQSVLNSWFTWETSPVILSEAVDQVKTNIKMCLSDVKKRQCYLNYLWLVYCCLLSQPLISI